MPKIKTMNSGDTMPNFDSFLSIQDKGVSNGGKAKIKSNEFIFALGGKVYKSYGIVAYEIPEEEKPGKVSFGKGAKAPKDAGDAPPAWFQSWLASQK